MQEIYSLRAEELVLANCLLFEGQFGELQNSENRLKPEDFHHPTHATVFKAMELAFDNHDGRVDTLVVSVQLGDFLAKIGGLEYLEDLSNLADAEVSALENAKIVLLYSQIRQTQGVLQNGLKNLPLMLEKPGIFLDDIQSELLQVIKNSFQSKSNFKKSNQVFKAVLDMAEENAKRESDIIGLSTGYPALDNITSGLQKGDLIILAARPSMGKTSLALNLMENIIFNDKSALFFSLEMTAESLGMRMLASVSQIPMNKLRSGRLAAEEWHSLASGISILGKKDLFIDDAEIINLQRIKAIAKRVESSLAVEQKKLDFIVIDYLQLIETEGQEETRATELSKISRGLKSLAKELHLPVLALSQLNRSLENRPNKRPMMSDLRESGAIEQDADIIMFIYRDEKYNPQSQQQGIAEIMIAKHRNGPTGSINLAFRENLTRFESISEF